MYSQEIDKILTDNRLSFKAKGIYLIIYQGSQHYGGRCVA